MTITQRDSSKADSSEPSTGAWSSDISWEARPFRLVPLGTVIAGLGFLATLAGLAWSLAIDRTAGIVVFSVLTGISLACLVVLSLAWFKRKEIITSAEIYLDERSRGRLASAGLCTFEDTAEAVTTLLAIGAYHEAQELGRRANDAQAKD